MCSTYAKYVLSLKECHQKVCKTSHIEGATKGNGIWNSGKSLNNRSIINQESNVKTCVI